MVENIILQHPQGCCRFFYSLSLLQSIFILSLFLRLPSLFKSILVICRVLPNDTTFVDFRSVSDNKFLSVSCYMWSILQSISLLPFAYYFSTKLNHHCGFFFFNLRSFYGLAVLQATFILATSFVIFTPG